MTIKNLIIRKEYKINEYRVPIIPIDCIKLLENNFIVYVEKSVDRCFNDELYRNVGCILIDDYTKHNFNRDNTLIIGLKDLDYSLRKDKEIIFKSVVNNCMILENILIEKKNSIYMIINDHDIIRVAVQSNGFGRKARESRQKLLKQ